VSCIVDLLQVHGGNWAWYSWNEVWVINIAKANVKTTRENEVKGIRRVIRELGCAGVRKAKEKMRMDIGEGRI
jgi:hypothetical protein